MSATLSRARSRYTFESQSRQRRSTDQLKTHLVAALGVRPTALSFHRGAAVPVVSFAVGSATAAIAVSKPTAPLRLSLGLVALLHLNEEADHRGVVQVVFLFHCFLSGENTGREKKREELRRTVIQDKTRGSSVLLAYGGRSGTRGGRTGEGGRTVTR